MGADVVVGTSQRFGVPIGFGGPHAAYMSVRSGLERRCPGAWSASRSTPTATPPAARAADARAAHPPREGDVEHLHRAGAAGGHGLDVRRLPRPRGARAIARRVHRLTAILAAGLRDGGYELVHDAFFDTIRVRVPDHADAVIAAARAARDQPPAGRRGHRRHLVRRGHRAAAGGAPVGGVPRKADDRAARRRDRRRDPAAARAQRPTSSRTRCSTSIARRRRCCATCARSRAGTSRSIAR